MRLFYSILCNFLFRETELRRLYLTAKPAELCTAREEHVVNVIKSFIYLTEKC